ncbi:hypothetical protein quinque_000025, partial [Culex quinquefasciatus]
MSKSKINRLTRYIKTKVKGRFCSV